MPPTQRVILRAMSICQDHNLRVSRHVSRHKPYGLRVSLREGDPFRKLLGEDWHRLHWFETEAERDEALADMSRKHEYSRPGDRPAHVYEKLNRPDGAQNVRPRNK